MSLVFHRYANRDLSVSSLNLGGRDRQNNTNFTIRRHQRLNTNIKPHHQYRNWVQGYQIPWVCFLEIAIMILYFLFGYIHQKTTLDFTLDFSKAVNDYFLSGFDFPTDDNGKIADQVPIFLRSKLLTVVNETGYRFLNFHEDFPCANLFLSDEVLEMSIRYQKNKFKNFNFGKLNINELFNIVESNVDDFDEISLNSTYIMQKLSELNDERLKLTVFTIFTFDRKTRIISLSSYHSRIPHFEASEWNNFINCPLITIPLIIIIISLIAIIFTSYYVHNIYMYSTQKAEINFQNRIKVFWSKFDPWAIYSMICHLSSIVACLTYINDQTDYMNSVPTTMILLSISTSLHCILLLRYLKQKSSTLIIINVTTLAIIKIGQFLVGCLIIFAAYLILGCSFFGTYDDTFETLIRGAECLLAVVHGDAIQDMFDAAALRADISVWFGVAYWGLWIFFSLTIMFNISISIFEEVLTKEIHRTAKEARKKDGDDGGALNKFNNILPLTYRAVF